MTGITGDEELAKSNPWRYRGYYFDEELGMYYNQSRYYDCVTGRWVNADDAGMLLASIIGLKGENLFEYCDGNPVNRVDYNGKVAKSEYRRLKLVAGLINILIAVTGWGFGFSKAFKSAGGSIKTVVNLIKNKSLYFSKELFKKKIIKGISIALLKSAFAVVTTIAYFWLTCFNSIGDIIAHLWDWADVNPGDGYVDLITASSVKKIGANIKKFFKKANLGFY